MSTYLERAMKFSNVLAELFEGCRYLNDFQKAITDYNHNHARPIKWDNGVSRIVIMRSDYVIKFDYENTNPYYHRFGNCTSEKEIYDTAVKDHMEHLLAETTICHSHGMTFSIMPCIKGVGIKSRVWCDYCSRAEAEWIWDNIGDIHCWNVGYRNGKVCIIDYAY